MIRPLFSFFGAKWRLAPHYPKPEYGMIVEPFAGSAGYSCRYPDRQIILVERDPVIAELWRWLIRASSAEVLALPLLEKGCVVPADLHPAAATLIGFWCNKAATYPRRRITGTWGERYPDQFWGENIRARVARDVEHIRHWHVIEGDYFAAPNFRATWFVDPPYVGRQVASKYSSEGGPQMRAVGDRYRFGTRAIDYRRLGAWCRERHGLVIACEAAGADWLPFRHFAHAKSTTHSAGVGRTTEEVVWISKSGAPS